MSGRSRGARRRALNARGAPPRAVQARANRAVLRPQSSGASDPDRADRSVRPENLNASKVMYLRFDSRRAPANDVKLGSMTARTPSRRFWFGAGLAIAALLATLTPAGRISVAAANRLIGQTAPDFALPAFAGSNVRLSEYRGQPVVVSFWSSRCSTCAKQLATLDRLYNTYRSSGLIVLAISVDDDAQRAQQYARAHAQAFPLLIDSSKSVSRAFTIERLPASVLIDRSGVVRYLHDDDRADEGTYVTQIRALLDDNVTAP